jgi:tetratricopeptide (TPR) repeat protein
MKRWVLLTVACASLLVLNSNQATAKDTWTRVQTRNFTLVGNASERDIRKIAIKLEIFRQTLALMFPQAKITIATPTTVVIFKSDDAFRPFKPRYQGKIRDNVGGYFLPGPDMNYIVLAAGNERIDPYEVIFHEYEHFVLRNSLLHLPAWLDEGLAEFYSSFETSDDEQHIRLGIPLAKHVFYLRGHMLLPLKTLVAVDRSSPYYNESSKAGVFYAESWALVHYLMNENEQKRQPQLVKFIELVNLGAPPEESFQKAFGTDFKSMESELRSYVGKFSFPVVDGTFHSPPNFAKDVQSVALSDAEVQYYGGDLLLNLRQFPEAKVMLEKSIEFDSRYSPALVSLGILRLFDKQPTEAEHLFKAAIDSDPKNYLAHYYYAQTLRWDRPDEAIKSYQAAIALKPDLARLFLDLGYAYLSAGNEEEAIKTFEEGLRVNAKETYFNRTLSYIYLQRDDGERAAVSAYRYLQTAGWRAEHSQYMVLVWYLALRHAKHDEFGTRTLRDALAKVDPNEWPYPVLQYLNHSLTLSELFAQANDNDKLTEAHAYAGLVLSLNGERQAAIEHLRWVRENGNKSFVEYPLALAELDRLETATAPKSEP